MSEYFEPFVALNELGNILDAVIKRAKPLVDAETKAGGKALIITNMFRNKVGSVKLTLSDALKIIKYQHAYLHSRTIDHPDMAQEKTFRVLKEALQTLLLIIEDNLDSIQKTAVSYTSEHNGPSESCP